MTMLNQIKSKQPLPVDVSLLDKELLDDGVMFVVLPTLADLEQFWREHKTQFLYGCNGHVWETNTFLRGYEWVFGSSKAAVVRAVMRWDVLGLKCEFYDWAKHEPIDHVSWFRNRDLIRTHDITAGLWTVDDENTYQVDCVRRSPSTYRGWWTLGNLPHGYDQSEWFSSFSDADELFDYDMPIAQVTRMLQEKTFDDWKASDVGELQYHDRDSIDAEIDYWRQEQQTGQGYYGVGNEDAIGLSCIKNTATLRTL